MITCPKCSKDNQDHYKFCLGCGAELPRDAAPKPFSPRTPPQGMKAAQASAVPVPAGSRQVPTAAIAPPAPVAAPAPIAAPPAPVPVPAPAPAPAPTPVVPRDPSTIDMSKQYLIGPEDVLDIAVWNDDRIVSDRTSLSHSE